MPRFVRSAALATTVTLVAALAAGCSGSSDDKNGKSGGSGERPAAQGADPEPRPDPSSTLPAAVVSQKLDWRACEGSGEDAPPGDEWRCATLKVPLDYAKPDGGTIGIALIRAASTAKKRGDRIGSLVFNFGGPGGSGVSMLPAFAGSYGDLRERYDLVSFDPRGVAGSEGLRCRSDKQTRAAENRDPTPDTAAEEKAYLADAAAFGAGCARDAKKLLPHVSTADAARDMDVLRQVIGDEKLHYFGISYGTELGGTYAHLFPEKVGRLTLDAPVDPTAGAVGHARNQARGFQRALENYLRSSGEVPGTGTRKIAALLRRLDAKPLRTSTPGRRLSESLATTGILVALYSRQTWPVLTDALEKAEKGDGSGLLELADTYNERSASGTYSTQSHSQRAIACRDTKERPTAAEAKARLARFREISPVFGGFMAWDTAGWCHDWPVAGLQDTPEVSAPGAAPVLVVGTTGDPATPYEGARKMADELGEGVGVQLTWKGEGHGTYGNGSDCVDGTVNDYLLKGKVPRDGKVCAP
ncbi:alpha/beta hydrolase [Streptomyces spectabilis]|uniref:Alpha/beta hydrolase n=1 Tax=Streptomyces spectabilis TaxID=68270 RepID=A0A5P2XFK1_STRST|nr:alpha/beta hydrolase [Streptomyces spectabilis]MBB5104692.1 pimeloyl-ACP methyl ester carboxylesterase [Streptomyces spectabilis]MCI3904954.1 alpha/beta hydrolase [Streptomyces spectabilis]QEV61985.1 alpha/beta hydrolase [Streptomyces spectabilis]GGV01611.1 peptidase [Streptomyces spectabilis]